MASSSGTAGPPLTQSDVVALERAKEKLLRIEDRTSMQDVSALSGTLLQWRACVEASPSPSALLSLIVQFVNATAGATFTTEGAHLRQRVLELQEL